MDINAVRKRLAQLQTTNTRTTNLWKPQPGKTQIRIVPYLSLIHISEPTRPY